MQDIRSKIKHYIYHLFFFLHVNPDIKRFFVVLALVLVLPLAISAALTVQNLRQKASGSDYIKVFNAEGRVIDETTDQNVQLQITLPPDWQLPTQGRNDGTPLARPGLVGKAYAQEACNATTTTCGQTTYDTCSPICTQDHRALSTNSLKSANT